jgi:hypothetical protein
VDDSWNKITGSYAPLYEPLAFAINSNARVPTIQASMDAPLMLIVETPPSTTLTPLRGTFSLVNSDNGDTET